MICTVQLHRHVPSGNMIEELVPPEGETLPAGEPRFTAMIPLRAAVNPKQVAQTQGRIIVEADDITEAFAVLPDLINRANAEFRREMTKPRLVMASGEAAAFAE